MVSSRNEELMTALINGEDVKDYIPRSRNEQFLKDCAVGSETTTLEPRSRSEMLLSEVHNKIKSGGGFDIDLKSVFDQTKSTKYFFRSYYYYNGKDYYNIFHYLKDFIKRNEINEYKQYLAQTDYVISKLNEAKIEDETLFESLKVKYADILNKRKEARAKINELELS